MRLDRSGNWWKGFFAGATAGLIGSFAMSQFHSLVGSGESSKSGEEDSTIKTAAAISQRVFQHELTPEEKRIAGPSVHYAFAASVGGIYGGLVELSDIVHRGWGIPLGASVWLGAHVITVPALGLSKPVTESTPSKEATEFSAHVVYGGVVEAVRRFMRASLIR